MTQFSLKEHIAMFSNSLRSIGNLYEQYAKMVGLTYIGLSVLECIYTSENCTQKYISEHTKLPKQTVNIIIKSFWENGYVEMKEIKTDRRNKSIELTPSGRKYANEIIGKLIMIEESIIGQLSYQQRQDIIEITSKLENSFKEVLLIKENTIC